MKNSAMLLAILFCLSGCSTQMPSLVSHLQTQEQLKNIQTPTHLTDLGILLYGEAILATWGGRSVNADVFNTTGQITLAALSTGALASAGTSGVSPNATKGLVAGFNFLLQTLSIIKPAERNDARHEGAAMILDARGNFLEALAVKRIYHVSNTRFTPQGAIYFRQIGAAVKVVDKLIVGLAPRIEDLKQLEPVPIDKQPNPLPEPEPSPVPNPNPVLVPAGPAATIP